MKYFFIGLFVFIVGGWAYPYIDAKVRRWIFLRKVRRMLDSDDKLMAEAKRKGLIK